MGFLQKLLLAIVRPFVALFVGLLRMAIFVVVLCIAAFIFWRSAVEGMVTRSAESLLGVPVEVGGVDVTLDNGFGVAVSGLVAENPDWATRDDLLKIDTMVVHVNPWVLATGRMLINDMTISGLSLSLERGAEGAGGVENYAPMLARFKEQAGNAYGPPVVINQFTVQNAQVFIRDGDNAVELQMPVLTGRYSPPGNPGALALDTFSLYSGGSDVTGALLVEPGLQHNRVSGDLKSSLLDLPRLFPRAPSPPRMKSAPPEAVAKETGDALMEYLFENMKVLQTTDLNVRLDADDLRLPDFSAIGVHVVLLQEGGLLQVRDAEE